MNVQSQIRASSPATTEHFDVLIAGAGISGVGAAYHLATQCPGTSFVALETQKTFGGTWSTHRYPGIRSDSDLHTFGYRFKPWTSAPIASAAEILKYMGEVIEENDLSRHIRYQHTITSAKWSSEQNLWTIEATRGDTGETVRFTANFFWMCQGYYRHTEGYTPEWKDMAKFKGPIVHPQKWPEDLDYNNKRIVEIAEQLRQLQVDETWIHEITRRKILFDQDALTRKTFEEPEAAKKDLLSAVEAYLGSDYDIATHVTPKYRPWRQRIAFIPDGDLFQGIKAGKASVVTDEIDRFTETGILLKSGKTLEADIIVTATGFNLSANGDMKFCVDGKPLDFADTVTYRGMMFTGVPNLVWVFGYFRASWTLRVDLVADFVCKLLNHMKATGAKKVSPALRPEDHNMPLLPWIDPENFNPGYMMRGMHLLPKRGDKPEWQHNQDYWAEKDEFPAIDLGDRAFVYE